MRADDAQTGVFFGHALCRLFGDARLCAEKVDAVAACGADRQHALAELHARDLAGERTAENPCCLDDARAVRDDEVAAVVEGVILVLLHAELHDFGIRGKDGACAVAVKHFCADSRRLVRRHRGKIHAADIDFLKVVCHSFAPVQSRS